jgi:hypothetical protein
MIRILGIHRDSFKANIYTEKHFRMIGLIDAIIKFDYGIERVTLAYFRSSGTNSGKIKGLWYPIVGIKTVSGEFTEFTDYINHVLTNTTRSSEANAGWLAKSLFFPERYANSSMIKGFSGGRHYEELLETGMILRDLYENNKYRQTDKLDAVELNRTLMSGLIYPENTHSQRENYHKFIENVYGEYQ